MPGSSRGQRRDTPASRAPRRRVAPTVPSSVKSGEPQHVPRFARHGWRKGRDTVNVRSVAIIDNQPMFRDFLALHVKSRDLGLTLDYVGPFNAEAASAVASADDVLVVLDLDVPPRPDQTSPIRGIVDSSAVVLGLCASPNRQTILGALDAGVMGLASRYCEADEFDRALDAVLAGRLHVSPELTALAIQRGKTDVVLSDQERRALSLYASGLHLDAVAHSMGVRSGTAKEYIKRVREKYAVAGERLPSKIDLYRKAQEQGLL